MIKLGRLRQQVINEAQRNASHVVTKVLLMTEDVVLYVWVDDAFVRHHKKLVQVHYFVEILTRQLDESSKWALTAIFQQECAALVL